MPRDLTGLANLLGLSRSRKKTIPIKDFPQIFQQNLKDAFNPKVQSPRPNRFAKPVRSLVEKTPQSQPKSSFQKLRSENQKAISKTKKKKREPKSPRLLYDKYSKIFFSTSSLSQIDSISGNCITSSMIAF